MEDAEIIECVAAAVGANPAACVGGRVVPLSGKQGLLIGRVLLANGRSYVFKAVKESTQREVRIAPLISDIVPTLVPRVYAAEQDAKRGLYWLVAEDVGPARLADNPTPDGYVAAAVALARLQLATVDHLNTLCDAGTPLVDSSRWEEIALRTLESIDEGAATLQSDVAAFEQVVWSVSALASDATMCPVALIHGDLHAGNVALCPPPARDSGPAVKLLDWGSAYLGAAFLGLEELLWPASRHLRTPDQRLRVRAAYLREWAPMLGKPGPLEKCVAACSTLVRLELLDESLRRPHQYDAFAAASIERRLFESFDAWRRL